MTKINIRKNKVELTVDGRALKRLFLKDISRKKLDLLFIKLSESFIFNEVNIEFYDLFSLEVYALLQYAIEDKESKYGLDVEAVKEAMELIKKHTWVRNIFSTAETVDTLDYSRIKKNMKFSILEHQYDAFKYYNNSKTNLGYRGGMLDMAVGSGKTFTSLAITEAIHADTVIVVCPLPTLNKVWEDSLKNTLYKKPQSYCIIRNTEYKNEKFILVHYEGLSKIKNIKKLKGKVAIIVDESHNFADPKSERTKLLKDLIANTGSDDIILMSGTPIKATAAEVMNMMEILDRRFVGPAKERFKKLYKGMGSFLSYTLSVRYRAHSVKITKDNIELPELSTVQIDVKLKDPTPFLLTTISEEVKRYAKERLKYFNDNKKKYEDIYFTLRDKAKINALKNSSIDVSAFNLYEANVERVKELYKNNALGTNPELVSSVNEFEKKVIIPNLNSDDKKAFRNAKTVYKYVGLKIVGETLSNVIGKAREECHVAIASDFNFKDVLNSTEAKTVIFTKYLSVADAVCEKTKIDKFKPITVYGDTSKDLSKNVQKFKDDEKANPLVTTYKSLSTGVPLIEANVILAIDLPYMSYELEQTIARIVRIGQTRPCTFYFLSLNTGDEPNINSRNIDINKLNNEAVAEITGYKNQTVLEDAEAREYNDKTDISLPSNITIVSAFKTTREPF
jgi:superfamily II DNA or RNA helicase